MAGAPSSHPVGTGQIERVERIGSTNAELLARIARGEILREGGWLVADRQDAGRGRLGRVWQDGAGNFMGSTAVALRAGDPPAHSLALVAGIALYEALAALLPDDRRPMLKWPNDVLLDGAKLAGILLERQGDSVVIGVGVNLASAPDLPDRPATSLAAQDLFVPRDPFARALAARMSGELAAWRALGLAETVARWIARGPRMGTRVATSPAGEERLSGEYRGLDAEGALLMRLDNGAIRAIHAGEVEILRDRGD